MTQTKRFIPLIVFCVLCVFLYLALGKDSSALPSAKLGKPLPVFEIPSLESELTRSITDKDLVGEVFLLNIWATWCAPCLIEHPYFLSLAEQGVKIVGVNYKDRSDAALDWLKRHKNPYALTLYDAEGRLGFDLGVTGVPETYLVSAKGEILYRHIGVVDAKVWEEHFQTAFEP